MSTRDAHNQLVRKQLKDLSSKFEQLYEDKRKEFDTCYSEALAWLHAIPETIGNELNRYKLGLICKLFVVNIQFLHLKLRVRTAKTEKDQRNSRGRRFNTLYHTPSERIFVVQLF